MKEKNMKLCENETSILIALARAENPPSLLELQQALGVDSPPTKQKLQHFLSKLLEKNFIKFDTYFMEKNSTSLLNIMVMI